MGVNSRSVEKKEREERLRASFAAIAGDDGVVERSEFDQALREGKVRVDPRIVPPRLRARLFDLAVALEAGKGSIPMGNNNDPENRKSAGDQKQERKKTITAAGLRYLAEALSAGDAETAVRWMFFLADDDGSGTLDASEAEALWDHLWQRFAVHDESDFDGDAGDEGLGKKGSGEAWASSRPVRPVGLPGNNKITPVSPSSLGNDAAGKVIQGTREKVWRAVVDAAALGKPGGGDAAALAAAGLTRPDVLSICQTCVRIVQIGFAMGLQAGVIDPATGRLHTNGITPRQVDPAHPELLRFRGSEVDALRKVFFAEARDHGSQVGQEAAIDEEGLGRVLSGILPTPELRRSMFRLIDADRSGHATLSELTIALDSLVNGSLEERVRSMFALYDADASGDLCIDDLGVMVRDAMRADARLAPLVADASTDRAVRALLTLADSDRSGTLSESEVLSSAASFLSVCSKTIGILPRGVAFGADSRGHPMDKHPRLALLLLAFVIYAPCVFNLIFDGPGLQGPLLAGKFGWSVGSIARFAVYYQAAAVPGNIVGGSLVERFGSGAVFLVTNLMTLAAVVLQFAAVSGSGSYALYVVSRVALGASESLLPLSSVILGSLTAPRFITTASAVKTCLQFGVFTVSRVGFSSLDLDAYHSLMLILQVVAVALSVAIFVWAPRLGFPVGVPGAHDRDVNAVGRPLVASLADFTTAAQPPPTIKASALRRLKPIYWANVWLTGIFFGVLLTFTAIAPFWFTSRGESLAEANVKTNMCNIAILATTVPVGALANQIGYRAHIFSGSYLPAAVALLLAAAVGPLSTWAVAIIFALGWGGVSSLAFGLVPLYDKDRGIHGTAFGVLMSLSSLAMMLMMVIMSALAPSGPGDQGGFGGAMDFYRSGALILGVYTATAVPVGMLMVGFDRKNHDLKAGRSEMRRRELEEKEPSASASAVGPDTGDIADNGNVAGRNSTAAVEF